MHILSKTFLLFLIAALLCALPRASAFTAIDAKDVTICEAQAITPSPPDFSAVSCQTTSKYALNPQNRAIWIKANITLQDTAGADGAPLALFVSGKMSTKIYLNGEYVGQNGVPGIDASSETPGLMDATVFPRQDLFKQGPNEIILLASAHHGILELAHPVHFIGAAPAGDRRLSILDYYWPSLITLGLFILGLLYFAILAVIGGNRVTSITFSLICAFASAQLLTEVARGLVSYTYPMHDWRLIAITIFSAGFGLSVAFHVFYTFLRKRIGVAMIGALALSVCGVVPASGFDVKASSAMLMPLCLSLIATAWWTFQKRERAFAYFLILLVFVAAILVYPSMFLDVIFFFLVALFLLLLLLEQGVTLAREAKQRRAEEARANRLELALEQVRQTDQASEISVKSAGKMERISTANIVQCRGAGGYSEIILSDGRELLHSATLAEMEEGLPSTFIRVHRSHLVNTRFIKTLHRDTSGTGTLMLSDGSEVAVSRRILPSVRQALG